MNVYRIEYIFKMNIGNKYFFNIRQACEAINMLKSRSGMIFNMFMASHDRVWNR